MTIQKTIASINKLHGGEREQTTRYKSFVAWQLAQREKNSGLDPSPILATEEVPAIKMDGRAIRDQIVRDGLLEDRLEYATHDLAQMYGITIDEAEELYELLHCEHRDNGRGVCCDCGHVL